MSVNEDALKAMLENFELEGVLLRYYAAVDSKNDYAGLLECFTPDAVFDVEPLGLATYQGHDAIRSFFESVFRETAHHVHHVTNFRVSRVENGEATARGYVFAKAEGLSGERIQVHCYYDIEYVRTAAGWKIRSFVEGPLMPVGNDISSLHGSH